MGFLIYERYISVVKTIQPSRDEIIFTGNRKFIFIKNIIWTGFRLNILTQPSETHFLI